jgi:hypothetical protein
VRRFSPSVQHDRCALHSGRFRGGRGRGRTYRLAINSVKAGQRKQFQQGYDQGASDTVKRQYWILQNLRKGKQEPAYRQTYYRFTIPPDPNAPVKTVPREIAIPIYE